MKWLLTAISQHLPRNYGWCSKKKYKQGNQKAIIVVCCCYNLLHGQFKRIYRLILIIKGFYEISEYNINKYKTIFICIPAATLSRNTQENTLFTAAKLDTTQEI